MRTTSVLVATFLIVSTMVLAQVVGADAGVGACVIGQGFSLTTAAATGPFAGVNVGMTNSTTGAYTTQAEYEAQCCAETHQPPDCFRPAA